MSTTTSALIQSTEIVENFVIDPNSLYNPTSNESITKLETLPIAVNYKTLSSIGDQYRMSFIESMNPTTYLDTGITLTARIPIKFTLKTPHSAVITSANYLDAINDFENICFRQYGLINAINNCSLQLNNTTINTVENLSTAFNMVAQYYSDDELNERFSCSLPDKYYNYNLYNAPTTEKTYKTLDDDGNEISFPRSIMEASDPFKGSFDSRYNSRKICFTFVPMATPNTTDITGTINLSTYIPFSLLGMPGNETSLYGVTNFNLSATFAPDFVSRIFSANQATSGTDFFSSISYSNEHNNKFLARAYIRQFSSPRIQKDKLGNILPYRRGYTSIKHYTPLTTNLTKGTVTNISSPQIVLTSIPKSIYIGLKLKTQNASDTFKTPDVYARFQSLSIQNGVSNNIIATNDCAALYELCKGNGLNKDIESALRGCMFAVKVNSSDLGWSETCFVGENKNFNVNINASVIAVVEGMYELVVVSAHQNSLIFHEGQFSVINGLISNAEEFKEENYLQGDGFMPQMTVVGGFGFSDVLNLGKKIGRYVSANHKDIREGLSNQWKKFQAAGNIVGGANTGILGAGSTNSTISSMKFKPKVNF